MAVISDVDATPQYVQWSAVIAGAVAASAASFVLLTAGAAVGLSLLSAEPGQSYTRTAGSLAAFWILMSTILSFMIGGYLAGRMRNAWPASSSSEIAFRDGAHGALVWSVGVVIGAILSAMAISSTASTAGAVADRAASVAAQSDTLLRTSPASKTPAATADERAEISRILVSSASSGKIADADRAYLIQVGSVRSGLPPAEVEKRVDETVASAIRAIETTRRATVASALLTVTALLVGLAAAWFAARNGGRHRDDKVVTRLGWTSNTPAAP